MTPHQVSVAAESFAATLLAQGGYNVSVQYGANQPAYDIIADGPAGIAKISVKGSQDGGWLLAVSRKHKNNNYHQAIDDWLKNQAADVIFVFVQFLGVKVAQLPRAYMATAKETAHHLKSQRNGNGHLALLEDYLRDHPKTQFPDKIPDNWKLTQARADELISRQSLA